MPLGTILSKQAINTLTQPHAEIAGKIESNRVSGDKLRAQMMHVKAVIKMLSPDFDVSRIAPKRRNTGNPWFKRGTLCRAVLDVMRDAPAPLTAAQICNAVLEGKQPQPTLRQATVLQNAILSLLRTGRGRASRELGRPIRRGRKYPRFDAIWVG